MLPKRERLTKKDFSVLSRRNMIRNTLFDIGYLASPKTKVACVVSKKTLPRAVDRNKVKRRMYNLFQECKPNTPYIILFYPKPEVLYTPYSELKKKMLEIFAKL